MAPVMSAILEREIQAIGKLAATATNISKAFKLLFPCLNVFFRLCPFRSVLDF